MNFYVEEHDPYKKNDENTFKTIDTNYGMLMYQELMQEAIDDGQLEDVIHTWAELQHRLARLVDHSAERGGRYDSLEKAQKYLCWIGDILSADMSEFYPEETEIKATQDGADTNDH